MTDTTIPTYRLTSARGIRVHRSTCKKMKNDQPFEDFTEDELLESAPASCCKPSPGGVDAAIAEVLKERKRPTPVAETAPSAETPEEVTAYDEDVADDPEYDGTEDEEADSDLVTEAITADGVPKYFARWALRGGVVLAEALGVQAERTKGTLVLTGPAEEVDRVQEVLFSAWEASYEAFKAWRKPREFYGNDDKVRWDTEVAFLQDFMLGVAASVRGATYAKDDTPEGVEAGLVWNRDR